MLKHKAGHPDTCQRFDCLLEMLKIFRLREDTGIFQFSDERLSRPIIGRAPPCLPCQQVLLRRLVFANVKHMAICAFALFLQTFELRGFKGRCLVFVAAVSHAGVRMDGPHIFLFDGFPQKIAGQTTGDCVFVETFLEKQGISVGCCCWRSDTRCTVLVILVSLRWWCVRAWHEFLIELSVRSKSKRFLLKIDVYVSFFFHMVFLSYRGNLSSVKKWAVFSYQTFLFASLCCFFLKFTCFIPLADG